MNLVDTHCHIQSAGLSEGEKGTRELWAKDPSLSAASLIKSAQDDGVTKMIAVGCDLGDSELATACARQYPEVWASVGIHPHEAGDFLSLSGAKDRFEELLKSRTDKVVAIGETGLDYHYNHSDRASQQEVMRFQLNLASKYNLPVIFHVREAFNDFWPIFDEFKNIKGVVHSFSSSRQDLKQCLERGLYIGLNGIMTFTNSEEQLKAAKEVPLNKLLLETDAPFLTPSPYRGKICQPKHVCVTAEFLSGIRGETLERLAAATTYNAHQLFGI